VINFPKTTAILNDKKKHKNTTLVNLTQFNDKLTYLRDLNKIRKLRVSFLIYNFVRLYMIIANTMQSY